MNAFQWHCGWGIHQCPVRSSLTLNVSHLQVSSVRKKVSWMIEILGSMVWSDKSTPNWNRKKDEKAIWTHILLLRDVVLTLFYRQTSRSMWSTKSQRPKMWSTEIPSNLQHCQRLVSFRWLKTNPNKKQSTPQKTNMELKHHPFGKGNSSSKPSRWSSMLIFLGVNTARLQRQNLFFFPH